MREESNRGTEPVTLAPIVAREVDRLIKAGDHEVARATVEEFARDSGLSVPQGIALLRLASTRWLAQGRYEVRRSTLDSLVELGMAERSLDPLGAGYQYRLRSSA